MSETVSDHVVQILQDWGVDTVFGLPGDGINGLVEAFRKAKNSIRYVHCRHEESAALAACAYAKFTGRLGVCFATAAPGAVHLLNGLYDAKIDGAPVLAITGMTYHDLIGTALPPGYQPGLSLSGRRHLQPAADGSGPCRERVEFRLPHRAGERDRRPCRDPDRHPGDAASQEKRFKRNVKGHTSARYQPAKATP